MKNLILISSLFVSQNVFAWGDMGHQIVANVAEQTINSKTKDFIRGVLGVEPMANAAIWPDLVRDDHRFAKRGSPVNDFSPYHFCSVETGHDYKSSPRRPEKDAYSAIMNSQKVLVGRASREEKMIALRYLVHLVGDIHQPLHVGNGFDMGGNACQIKWKNGQINLHSFWDSTLVTYVGETYANEGHSKRPAKFLNDYINVLKKKYPGSFTAGEKEKQSAGSNGVEKWLQESQAIREGGVYPDKAEDMKNTKKGEEYKSRPYCDWYAEQDKGVKGPGSRIDFNRLPNLDKSYADKYAPVVESQLLKGGLRLAKILDEVADSALRSGADSIDDSEETEILKKVQNALKH